MNIKIKLFEEKFWVQLGQVFMKYIFKQMKKKTFYVGESVFVLVKCVTHLFETAKGNGYLGFNKEMVEKDMLYAQFKYNKGIF